MDRKHGRSRRQEALAREGIVNARTRRSAANIIAFLGQANPDLCGQRASPPAFSAQQGCSESPSLSASRYSARRPHPARHLAEPDAVAVPLGPPCHRDEVAVLEELLRDLRAAGALVLLDVKRGDIEADAYPLSIQLSREFRSSAEFSALVSSKMSLGSEVMKEIGNVYCAALPAWMAAGMEDAYMRGIDLSGSRILAVGYGSGDAAEAMPMEVPEGWQSAAARIGFEAALEPYQNLTREQYEALHDTGNAEALKTPGEGFVIDAVGTSSNPKFSDEGIEYYRFVR